MVDAILNAIVDIESILDNEKGKMEGGVHLQLCTAVLKAFRETKGFQKAHFGGDENDNSDDDDDDDDEEEDEEEEEGEEEGQERREDDMELNERGGSLTLADPLEALIESIVEDGEAKCVCAALRVINAAVRGSNPDDPAEAERILEWKEELVEERAIFTCGEILEKTDKRAFHREEDERGFHNEDEWLYSIICGEILELFQRLGKDDALFRTYRKEFLYRTSMFKRAYARSFINTSISEYICSVTFEVPWLTCTRNVHIQKHHDDGCGFYAHLS